MATEREELKAKAAEIGLEYKGNISTADLQFMVDEAEAKAAEDAVLAEAAKAPVADPETAEKLIKEAEASKDKASGMRASTEVVKVQITALDPRMREVPSDMYTHMSKYGTKKQVANIKGKPQLVNRLIVDCLKEKQTLMQVNTVNGKGRSITNHQMSPAFVVNEVPLTEEEIDEIKGK